jgi:hypothetical protein
MANEHPEGFRSGVDYFHFTVVFAGFCFAVGGVVISSPCIGCCGLVLMAWGLVYFAVNDYEL